ncbi:hypothetical protein LXA43DRAFT_1101701 [Ganoderma leucocontextum]|nr:hypothetical protein LXA43DRAFT_1101701 [Ganoderma leucocontextum]
MHSLFLTQSLKFHFAVARHEKPRTSRVSAIPLCIYHAARLIPLKKVLGLALPFLIAIVATLCAPEFETVAYHTDLLTEAEPWKCTLPHFVEASRLPCVRALVKAVAPDEPLPETHFARIEARLREEAQPYCTRVRRDVARIFRLARAAELGVRWDSSVGLGVDAAAPDPEAALLDMPDALFRCSSFPCNAFSRTVMTVSGKHWQKSRPVEWNEGQRIARARPGAD